MARPPSFGYAAGVSRRNPDQVLELFWSLTRTLQAEGNRVYASLDLGSTQAKFLRLLRESSGASQADLARATGSDPTLTGRVVQTLIDKGWVRRKRSTEDRRQYLLEVTASGERLGEKVEQLRKTIAQEVGSALDERDLTDLERIVKKVLAKYSRS